MKTAHKQAAIAPSVKDFPMNIAEKKSMNYQACEGLVPSILHSSDIDRIRCESSFL